MISPELNARIAQWAGLWKPCTLTPMSSVPIRECACGYKLQGPYADGIHDNPVPDLSTPENLAKVKAALIAMGDVDFGTAYCAEEQQWAAWASRTIEKPEIRADTEADALLAAIEKLRETQR